MFLVPFFCLIIILEVISYNNSNGLLLAYANHENTFSEAPLHFEAVSPSYGSGSVGRGLKEEGNLEENHNKDNLGDLVYWLPGG